MYRSETGKVLSHWRWTSLLLVLLAAMFLSVLSDDSAFSHFITIAAYSLVLLGTLRAAENQSAGLWLQDGSQTIVIVLLAVLGLPLAAGLAGLFLVGQIALQPGLYFSGHLNRIRYSSRSWPWLMAAMLTAALALQ